MVSYNKKALKIVLAVLLTLSCLIILCLAIFRSPKNHYKDQLYLNPENINFNHHKADLEFDITASSGVIFKIKQINNAPKDSINPYFPIILIEPNVKVYGWIHIVYTDDINHLSQWKILVDYNPKWTNYPFYSNLDYFYDAPLWHYSLFNKPLSVWKGHAFAINIDHQKKSINCLGGVEWGFELSYFRLRPKTTTPRLLDEQSWEKAWKILQEKLPQYSQTYATK